jgi:hypothetical protein
VLEEKSVKANRHGICHHGGSLFAVVVLLLINQKTSSGPYCTRLVVYKYDNKRDEERCKLK